MKSGFGPIRQQKKQTQRDAYMISSGTCDDWTTLLLEFFELFDFLIQNRRKNNISIYTNESGEVNNRREKLSKRWRGIFSFSDQVKVAETKMGVVNH